MNIELLKEYIESPRYNEVIDKRFEFLEKSNVDPFYRAKKWKDFSEDIFDWIEHCAWVYEPRLIDNPSLAMIPFPHQSDAILACEEAIESPHDVYFEKSRDVGLSWIVTTWASWRWMFKKGFSALFGSRKEDYVDNKMVDSLFGKIRYTLHNQPAWLKPNGFKKKMHDNTMKLINPEMRSVIQGESSNENFSRSGRNQVIVADEIWFWPYAREAIRAMSDSSPCRIFISTPVEDTFVKRFVDNYKKQGWFKTIHWSQHPFKDETWYKQELERRKADPNSIAAELELSYDVEQDIRYYPEAYQCKALPIAYDPSEPIYCGLDFGGFVDYSAIIWYQFINGKVHVLESYCAHGRLMGEGKILLDWWLPFLDPMQPYDKDWYDDHEIMLLNKIRTWPKPLGYYGEAAHKQRHAPLGVSIFEHLAKHNIIALSNDYAVQFADRKIATQKYLPDTTFNSDSDGALLVLDALKSAKKPNISLRPTSDEKRAEKPLHLSGESDLRAAHENFCACIEMYVGQTGELTGSSYTQQR